MSSSYGPIANQRLKGSMTATLPNGEKKVLPAGAFVKAIRKEYLPKYHPFGDYNENIYVAVYSQHGMALIERYDIEWSVY